MSAPHSITWVLEHDAFPNGDCISDAAVNAGHRVIPWNDDWWATRSYPSLDGHVVFHGSLGNADRIHREIQWTPGAFCNTDSFFCSAWYESAKPFLLHPNWEILPASKLVAIADQVFDRIGDGKTLFVRPDSPLKPFSGRTVKRGQLTLTSLDHGFYFDDVNLPVVVAPVQSVLREWRFVVVSSEVCAGSAYLATGRSATVDSSAGEPWNFAVRVARALQPPDAVYVLDVCETPQGFRLLELNPFSGADLYACNGGDVVKSVSAALLKTPASPSTLQLKH